MKNFDTRVYSISDFVEWQNNGLLNLSPDFQRRSVWSEKAKSYLVDTIILGKPVPKILITQELQGVRNIRVVVDGQQRLRSILDFIAGNVKISRAHSKEFANFTYDKLPSEMKSDFLKYELGVDVLFDTSYEDILDIFSRLNAYTVSLNPQEKFNAKYLGFFKQASYRVGYRYVRYFIDSQILTATAITRMGEAELAADLMMSLIGGVQANKNVENFYRAFEDEIGDLEEAETQFDFVMSCIGEIYTPEELSSTNWSRVQLFYTLFTSIAQLKYGLKGLKETLRYNIEQKDLGRMRVVLDEISYQYDEISSDLQNPNFPIEFKNFIDLSRRRTTDTGARIDRSNFICEKLISSGNKSDV